MMPASRRSFLRSGAALAGAFSINSLFNQLHAEEFAAAAKAVEGGAPDAATTDEDFWSVIQRGYSVNPEIINLNNGGVSPSPIVVQQAVERYNELSNEGPSYYMWGILDQGREPLRERLAHLAGAKPGEIAIDRNSTEALNTIIYGLPLKAGDEVIGCKQDYPHMIEAYRQRAERDGIVYKQISFDFPIEDDAAIVRAYEEAYQCEDAADPRDPHDQLAGPDDAGRKDLRYGACARDRGDCRWRPLVRAHGFQSAGFALRLLRHQPAQISFRAHRHRNDVGAGGHA